MLPVKNKGINNTINIAETILFPNTFTITILGNNNELYIEDNVILRGGHINIIGDNCKIKIGKNCILNVKLTIKSNFSVLNIGENVTILSATITLHEKGIIDIGNDCMFSGGVIMDVSDMHSIIDLASKKRLNPPKNITIKSHVWLANGVTVLKGVSIGENCVIGAKALVSSDIPNSCLAVGIPAKVIKRNITWDRKRIAY